MDYPGVESGPMVSQYLLHDFRFDGIPVTPRAPFPVPVDTGDESTS